MAKNFRCSIVTPSAAVFDDEVSYVSFHAWDGQQGVLADSSPILSQLGIGSVRLDTTAGGTRWYLLDGGFAQVADGQLSLLTENAIPADTLVPSDIDAELEAAAAEVTAAGADRKKVDHDHQLALAKRALAQMMTGRSGAN